MYNSVLAFTSLSAKVDESVTGGLGSYSFRIQGELYHKIGSLCPAEGQRPQFTQLYIHDTKHERQNRHAGTWFSKELVCSSFRWTSKCCRRAVKAAKTLRCYAMSARIHSCMSLSILGRGVSPALFYVSDVCVDIVEVWLHQLKNCAGNVTGVKMWGKINPWGGKGNESPWLISLYSLICSRRCWFLQRSQYRIRESVCVWERERERERETERQSISK